MHGFLESDSELANFLLRHPLIRVLHLAVDFAEDDEDDEDDEDEDEELHEDNEDKSKDDKDENDTMIALLPHLSAISIGKFNRWELIPKLLSSSAPRHITHLRLADAGETSVEMIGNAGQSLRCLELSTFCLDEWRKDANNIPMVKLLRDLPELLEVALRLPTAFISMVNDAGDLEHPPPLDVNDLVCYVQLLQPPQRGAKFYLLLRSAAFSPVFPPPPISAPFECQTSVVFLSRQTSLQTSPRLLLPASSIYHGRLASMNPIFTSSKRRQTAGFRRMNPSMSDGCPLPGKQTIGQTTASWIM